MINGTSFLENYHVASVIPAALSQSSSLLQAVHWLLRANASGAAKLEPWYLHVGLCCADEILREPNLGEVIGQANHASWMASAAVALNEVVMFLVEGESLPALTASGNSCTLSFVHLLRSQHLFVTNQVIL
jgi:hypothetical protein